VRTKQTYCHLGCPLQKPTLCEVERPKGLPRPAKRRGDHPAYVLVVGACRRCVYGACEYRPFVDVVENGDDGDGAAVCAVIGCGVTARREVGGCEGGGVAFNVGVQPWS
jgi:hypothetical protein